MTEGAGATAGAADTPDNEPLGVTGGIAAVLLRTGVDGTARPNALDEDIVILPPRIPVSTPR
jgi:hypothetical protein